MKHDRLAHITSLEMVKDLPGYKIIERRTVIFHSIHEDADVASTKFVTAKRAAEMLGWSYQRFWEAIKVGRVHGAREVKGIPGMKSNKWLIPLPVCITPPNRSGTRHRYNHKENSDA